MTQKGKQAGDRHGASGRLRRGGSRVLTHRRLCSRYRDRATITRGGGQHGAYRSALGGLDFGERCTPSRATLMAGVVFDESGLWALQVLIAIVERDLGRDA